MNTKKNSGISAIGISSLLVIFAVLCLTVFALLTVSTAKSTQLLSDNALSAAKGYYMADSAAEKTLAELRAGKMPAEVTEQGGKFCYAHRISATQLLAVEVLIDDKGYEILRWQAISTADWQADDRLPVWNGEFKEE